MMIHKQTVQNKHLSEMNNDLCLHAYSIAGVSHYEDSNHLKEVAGYTGKAAQLRGAESNLVQLILLSEKAP